MAGPKYSIDRFDALTLDLTAAAAICDAAKVLTALERAQADPKNNSLATGEGYAGGYVLRDVSLPDMLWHAEQLIARAMRQAEAITAAATKPEARP